MLQYTYELMLYCLITSVVLPLLVQVQCTILVDYEDRACPGISTVTCRGQTGNSVNWMTIISRGNQLPEQMTANAFLPPDILNETSTSMGSFFNSEITVTFIPKNQTTGLFAFNSTYVPLIALPTTLTCGNGSGNIIGSVMIEFATVPSPPINVMQVSQQGLVNSVIVTVRWDLPVDNGGRADLNYTVSISESGQPGEVSAVTTQMTANVTAQYESINTVSVMATNCIGSSLPASLTFRVEGCPIPTAPLSGTIGPVSSRSAGSKVTFQCDAGFTPTGRMVSTCLANSQTWGPDPAMFVCNQAQGTDPLAAQSFTVLDVTLSVVVSTVLSVFIGIAIGVCGTYLIIWRKRTPKLDEKKNPTTPFRISSPARQAPPILPPPRQGHVFYPPVSASDVELEENFAYTRSADIL